MASFSNFKSTIVSASNEAAGTTAGVTVYANTDALPYSGNNNGDQAYVSDNNRLYIWDSVGWYNVALINRAPTIASVLDSDNNSGPFALAIDGTATTITITAADSDGDPITYSATADSDFDGLATVSNSDNVFTITPFSSDSATTASGTITFKATDGVNIASSGVQTFTLAFLSTLWDETVLSIGTSSTNSLDNSTFIDRSTNAHTVTPTGSPVQTAFHPYLENWSVEFDGSGDNLTLSDSPDFYLDSDFTIEAWIYQKAQTSLQVIANQWGSGTNRNIQLEVRDQQLSLYMNRSNGTNYQAAGGTINTNTWYHIAGVLSGTTLSVFINGQSAGSVQVGADANNSAGPFDIGSQATNYRFNGYISDLRLTKGTALYTANFTPPTEKLTAVSGTSLLTCQSNRLIDNSSNAHAITPVGNVKVSAFNPFGQESEYAVGENKGSVLLTSNNQLEPITGSIVDVGTGDYTVEFWCYGIPNDDIVIDMRNGTTNTTGAMLMSKSTGFRYQSGSTVTALNGPDPALKQWLHVAVVRSSGNVTYYANGVGESLLTGDTTSFTSTSIAIGSSNTNGYDVVDGYVSDLKITKSAVYTANFTPPTAPVGNTNASLYLPMDNAGIFDKTGNNVLTLFGDTSTSTTQTKYADTAIYFDGSGDYITTDFPALGTSDFTIEFWINPSTIDSTYKALMDTRTSNANNPLVWIRENNVIYYYTGAADRIIGTTVLSTNTWYHVAACRSSGTTKLFLNGTQEGSDYSDTASYTADTLFLGQRFNASPTYYYHGYIENIQILKGVAKYTTNFTPPTKTQGRVYQAED